MNVPKRAIVAAFAITAQLFAHIYIYIYIYIFSEASSFLFGLVIWVACYLPSLPKSAKRNL
jgi:hypothetical protein